MTKSSLSIILSLALSLLASGVAQAAGDAAKGKQVFQRCKVCHAVKEDASQKLGPNLHDLFGRKAGTLESFDNYSPSMKKLDLVWTEETLMKYLAMPQQMVPGTTMAFAGLPKKSERQDLIAYLKKATQ